MPAKKKKKVIKRKLLKACSDPLENNETENDAFGKFISKKLNKILNPEQRMYAESLITKVTNYGILNKLSEFTDIMGNVRDYAHLLRDTKYNVSNTASYETVE